jgi:ferredoxin-thioredoxin reductase catalytic subunit
MKITLEEFAKKHNFKINPKYTFKYWTWLVEKLGRCPCDKDRKCPCPESVQEVKEKGRCLCNFFWSEEEYARRTKKTV